MTIEASKPAGQGATGNPQHSSDSPNKSIPVIRSVKNMFFRRQRGCILSVPTEEGDDSLEVSYKNTQLLKRFVSERGRIVPRRIANVSAKKQRQLKREIKRARILALLPFCESK